MVMTALDHLLAGRTALIVAHRLATIERVDEIVVLDRGQIVERGDHRTLMLTNGLYRALWNRQAERGNRAPAAARAPSPASVEATS
jgi:ATP-binding cassette subfamily B protein